VLLTFRSTRFELNTIHSERLQWLGSHIRCLAVKLTERSKMTKYPDKTQPTTTAFQLAFFLSSEHYVLPADSPVHFGQFRLQLVMPATIATLFKRSSYHSGASPGLPSPVGWRLGHYALTAVVCPSVCPMPDPKSRTEGLGHRCKNVPEKKNKKTLKNVKKRALNKKT